MTPLDAQCIASLPVGPGAYVLLGTNGLHYTGSARNLRERLRDHRAGRASLRVARQAVLCVTVQHPKTSSWK